ncbi:hemerythrin domain-containing protein [Taibaiella soli]|uniref:Hemerythrin domain-containing protein n=2 Tax=Taibaiella soli TaxID=1649169 RepID=A0A2W2A993_9BACT|nr:hemerythrin domain-containing protein [Taibaiella soli]
MLASVPGLGMLSSCGKDKDEEKEVSPPEDLMQEHGLLNRILLIYDHCQLQLIQNASFPLESLNDAAMILRTFVEDYHEKQEEDYLFPRFRKANTLTDLVDTLLKQHNAGRRITEELIQLSKTNNLTDADHKKMVDLLAAFNRMYRPHESREDTVLFPAFRKIVSQHEYDSLGEAFEKNEQKKFGKDGFETMVGKVADIEKKLGIYELAQFTPDIV